MDEKPAKIDPTYPISDGGLSVGRDAALGTIGAAVGLAVPLLGPPVQAFIGKFVQAPLEARRERWFGSIGEGLREVQDRLDGFHPSRLTENEEFISAVAQATRAAMATHYAEKLEALRNVVLNTAVGMTVDEVTRGAFMAHLEQFSTLHLRLMRILREPVSAPEIEAIGGGKLMEPLVPALVRALNGTAEPDVLNVVIQDLMGARLVSNPVDQNLTTDPMTSRCVTPIGLAFLRFIESPLPLGGSHRDDA